MSIANDIQNIYEFSQDKDKNFKDFAQSLLCFCEYNKEKINVNDIENFSLLIKENFKDLNENYKNFLLNFIEEYKKQGFVDYQKFYNNFQKNFKFEEEDNESKDDLKNSISNELLINTSYVDLADMMKVQQEVQKQNEQNVEKNLNENLEENTDSNQNKEVITPNQVIAFIKDEKTLMFPFSKESTLENKEFMKAFYADLDSRSNQELEMLLAKIRAKNEALRAELLNLKQKEQENKKEQIEKELQANTALTQEKKDLENQNSQTKEENLDSKEINDKLDEAIKEQSARVSKPKPNYEEQNKDLIENRKEKPKWWFFNKNDKKQQENEKQDEDLIDKKQESIRTNKR